MHIGERERERCSKSAKSNILKPKVEKLHICLKLLLLPCLMLQVSVHKRCFAANVKRRSSSGGSSNNSSQRIDIFKLLQSRFKDVHVLNAIAACWQTLFPSLTFINSAKKGQSQLKLFISTVKSNSQHHFRSQWKRVLDSKVFRSLGNFCWRVGIRVFFRPLSGSFFAALTANSLSRLGGDECLQSK